MDKKELLKRLDELADGDDDEAVLEIRSLIESSGEVEVGDEEREKLVRHFDRPGTITILRDCSLCDQIRSLIRQRPMVSRHDVIDVAGKLWMEGLGFGLGQRDNLKIDALIDWLRSIGVEIVEEKP